MILFRNNKPLINQFLEFCRANGIGELRIKKYQYTLPKISKMLGKDFRKVAKEDMIKLIARIEQSDYSEWTKHDYKAIIKRFYKWINSDEEYPDSVKWIKTTIKKNKTKLPDDLLTENDIHALIDSATHPRNKAIVSVLYESGCRIAELLGMKIKHISYDKYSPIILVNGKTGTRRIRIIDKNNYLKTWIDNHPFKKDSNAYVWISIAVNRKNQPLEYRNVVKVLRKLKKKAKITKPVNPHNFRHSRATHLAKKLTEFQMKQMFGWTMGSTQAQIYVHLSGRDLDEPLLKMSGLLDKEIEIEKNMDKALKQLVRVDPSVSKFLIEKLKEHNLVIQNQ
jgi:integrase/recombinase XerD